MRFWRDVGEAMTEGYQRQRILDGARVKFWFQWTQGDKRMPLHPMVYR